jgi:hypothetical protein
MARHREELDEAGPARRQELDEVRSALRRLGYLNHGFERFLLQDALRGQRPLRTLLRLTLKVGLLSGLALACGLAFALAKVNGSLASPLDLPVLFLHLFVPITLASAAAFLVLCGVLILVLRLYPVRHIETLSLAAAAVVGVAGLALSLWGARATLAESSRPQLVLAALVALVGAYMLVKLLHNALLALAIRFTDLAPRRRVLPRRWMGAAILGALFLLLLPVMLSARHRPLPPPESLPMAPGERVLLLGLDGVLPEEVDYLLARGELPALARLAPAAVGGGRLAHYRRRREPPASFWTSVATGVGRARHGVAALDSFLPLGARTPLARSGPLRAYFAGVEVPLGLAEYRPLLASRRHAFAFWELASRGGAPVLAVDWWATYPVDPVPGLVVAHDAYHLLAARVAGAVSPEGAAPDLQARVRQGRNAGGALVQDVTTALPAAAAAILLEQAIRPDLFYLEVFASRLQPAPRAAALYLPGLDIAAAGWRGGDLAFADLVRDELGAADRMLARALAEGGFATVAVVFDPGRRREGGSGRLLFWRRAGCRALPAEIAPEAVASGLLRALGMPQSAELPPPPAGCAWPAPPATVAGFGEPAGRQARPSQGAEYLENLKSLGYL